MFNKKKIITWAVVIITWLLSTTFAGNIRPWLNASYVNNFSQKWLFIISTSSNSIATNQIYPNPEKPYWWKIKNTFGMIWISKQSAFLDIWVNFNLNTKKFIVIDKNWQLAYSSFNKSRKINYLGTTIANKDLIDNLVGLTNSDDTVWYQCWTKLNSKKEVLCAGINNAVGFFKVPPYAVENRSNWIKILSFIKSSWFKQWWIIDKENYIEYGVLKQRNFKNNWNYYTLVKYTPKDNRYISSSQLNTYPITVPMFQFKGDWLVQVGNWNDGKVAYFGNNSIWLESITLDRFWKTTVSSLMDWAIQWFVSAFPKQSLWSKQVVKDGKTITKQYITIVSPSWTLSNLDYTNARKIDRDWTYPLLTATNKWIEIEPNVENSVKAMNMLSVLHSLTEWMVSNSNARYVFMKPFGILDPKFKTVKNFAGKDINYISDLGIRNLDADNKLKIIFSTKKIEKPIQAWVKYGAFITDYNNKWRMWYYKVASVWYKLGQYVDNWQVISVQLNWTWALEKVYSPTYAHITNIKLKDWTNWFTQKLSNNYILTHWSLGKFEPVWSFANKNLWLKDIYTDMWVKWWTVDNLHYIVNTVDGRFDKYDETDVRHINLIHTSATPTVLSWKNLTYITPTNTNWWNLLIGSLSGNDIYLDTYIPDTKQLLTWWAQLTSWSDSLNFFKTDRNTTILIDTGNILWKKTN